MTIRRVLPVLLVLLQSGLAVGHAHAHANLAAHTDVPHFHAHELLDLFVPDHDDHEHDGDDHDADAVDLSDLSVAPVPPPAFDAVVALELDLSLVDMGPAFANFLDSSPTPLGLPPPTAGPFAPLYITFCTLTI